ncbi:MAG: hypothetical protein Q9181_003041 [Wetmoreana brouardii]
MATETWSNINSGYELSPTTFTKRSRTKAEYYAQPGGHIFYETRHWKNERISNEARALIILAETRIPTPRYIRSGENSDGTMFLELAQLRSSTTGLDGFVMPPAWMLETDTRKHWKPVTFPDATLMFIHGDLGPSNLLMDPKTLKVKCVIDWENSGFFPSQFQKWEVDEVRYYNLYRGREEHLQLASSITA